MDVLGLPDPADYSPPVNGDQRHPTLTTSTATDVSAQPAGTSSPEPAAPAPADTTQDTYPAPAPTVEGVNVTESVYQAGQ